MRLFEHHPDLSITSYTFHDAFYWGPEPLLRRDIAQRIAQKGGITQGTTYQSRFNDLQKFIADAEAAGKIPFIKEHLYYGHCDSIVRSLSHQDRQPVGK